MDGAMFDCFQMLLGRVNYTELQAADPYAGHGEAQGRGGFRCSMELPARAYWWVAEAAPYRSI